MNSQIWYVLTISICNLKPCKMDSSNLCFAEKNIWQFFLNVSLGFILRIDSGRFWEGLLSSWPFQVEWFLWNLTKFAKFAKICRLEGPVNLCHHVMNMENFGKGAAILCFTHFFVLSLETDSLCSKFDLTHVTDIIKDYGVIELKEILGNVIWSSSCNTRKNDERRVHLLDSFLRFFLDVSTDVSIKCFSQSH